MQPWSIVNEEAGSTLPDGPAPHADAATSAQPSPGLSASAAEASLLTTTEVRDVRSIMALGCSRDRALLLLLGAEWDLTLARDRWLEQATVPPPVVDWWNAPHYQRRQEETHALPPPSAPAGSRPMCLLGCMRPPNRTTSQCCVSCPRHSITCRRRHRESQMTHEGPAPAAATTPVCPVCLEAADTSISLPCAHDVCHVCLAGMRAAGIDRCPLCRAPLDERPSATRPVPPLPALDTGNHEPTHGYVVLRTNGVASHQRGLHWCSWAELEIRLMVATGGLSGRLSHHRVTLRRVASSAWWENHHQGQPMPVFPWGPPV